MDLLSVYLTNIHGAFILVAGPVQTVAHLLLTSTPEVSGNWFGHPLFTEEHTQPHTEGKQDLNPASSSRVLEDTPEASAALHPGQVATPPSLFRLGQASPPPPPAQFQSSWVLLPTVGSGLGCLVAWRWEPGDLVLVSAPPFPRSGALGRSP